MPYCSSRFSTVRRQTAEVMVGSVGVGGANPIRIQSMTTSDTQDIGATVAQAIALAEAGCEIVRITAPNVPAARCLREIRSKLDAAGFGKLPLVADIHFLPAAAMEAVEHVEKVRVNPGNYADKKKFSAREYSDAEYGLELERLAEAFSPLVKRCKELGRSMRIGTNHGSLSDRIMNRYGDTPLGMVESALEFLRIAESHGFRQIILSMKASNPKVMIQAYRLLVERMARENMRYPLHLGVTEAGDGEDGRIKGAIGIGSLLLDGLGDTIRVSLTEDSVYEIPVARAIAEKAMSLWGAHPEGNGRDASPRRPRTARRAVPTSADGSEGPPPSPDDIDPFQFIRRETAPLVLGACRTGPGEPPRVVARVGLSELEKPKPDLLGPQLAETPAEGLLVGIGGAGELDRLAAAIASWANARRPDFLVIDLPAFAAPDPLARPLGALRREIPGIVLLRSFAAGEGARLRSFAAFARANGCLLACDITPADLGALGATLRELGDDGLVATYSGTAPPASSSDSAKAEVGAARGWHPQGISRRAARGRLGEPSLPSMASGSEGGGSEHPIGAYRQLAAGLARLGLRLPIWIRNTAGTGLAASGGGNFLSRLLDASFLTGGLLCDGIGDIVSIETEADPVRSVRLAYNVLQGAGSRISKTEFVACPSCGRTLFDLQTTTQRIRSQTGHLKGVKIAIMGCIVNGPGEMADADFGYVGGAPGKINLYVGRQCVQYNIPQDQADARLVALIKERGKWAEPKPAPA